MGLLPNAKDPRCQARVLLFPCILLQKRPVSLARSWTNRKLVATRTAMMSMGMSLTAYHLLSSEFPRTTSFRIGHGYLKPIRTSHRTEIRMLRWLGRTQLLTQCVKMGRQHGTIEASHLVDRLQTACMI